MDMLRALIGPDEGYQTMTQLSVRAVLLFAFGILCIRIAGRRTFSQAAPLDIIVYLIVGSNLSRVMTGGAHVLPSMAATLTLVVLHRLLAYATLRRVRSRVGSRRTPPCWFAMGSSTAMPWRRKGSARTTLQRRCG